MAVAAKDEGEGGSSGMLDEEEMKRQLMMMSPAASEGCDVERCELK